MGVVDKDENSYYSILKDLKKNTIRKEDIKKSNGMLGLKIHYLK